MNSYDQLSIKQRQQLMGVNNTIKKINKKIEHVLDPAKYSIKQRQQIKKYIINNK